MKTICWFLAFIVPLYILDQVTKWWCVLHFNQRTLVTFLNNKTGETYDGYQWLNADGQWKLDVIKDYVWFPRVHNQGVAWGIGNGSAWAPIVFLIIPVVALVVITILWKKGFFKLKPAKFAAPLLVAGIFGNLTDRLVQGFYLDHLSGESFWTRLSSGYVVDFLAVKIPFVGKDFLGYNFPVFNVADSCVSIAACMLLITAVFEKKLANKQGVQL